MANILEWECILECNYECAYCTNGRNSVLAKPIKYEKDETKVFAFLDSLKERYPDDELFLFGGEPFVHPFIDKIIGHLNKIGMKFIIQTNCSVPQRISKIALEHDFQIQVSVHPTEIKNDIRYVAGLAALQRLIRRIDIMYVGKPSLEWYKNILPFLEDKSVLYLAPLADFNVDDETHNNHLFEFNKLKQSIYGKVYQFEHGLRSTLWEEQMKNVWTPKGKPCAYKDRYILFDPALQSYSCNYRQNNDICPNQHCFLM